MGQSWKAVTAEEKASIDATCVELKATYVVAHKEYMESDERKQWEASGGERKVKKGKKVSKAKVEEEAEEEEEDEEPRKVQFKLQAVNGKYLAFTTATIDGKKGALITVSKLDEAGKSLI